MLVCFLKGTVFEKVIIANYERNNSIGVNVGFVSNRYFNLWSDPNLELDSRLSILLTANASSRCTRSHEVYSTCGCPLTCNNYKNERACKACVEGCSCEKGYVRNSVRECILPIECT